MESKKKILLVFGTRPEAIKMCPLALEFKKHSDIFQTSVCVTGQHREMLDQVLDIFGITPDYDLNIMRPGQTLYSVTSQILLEMQDVLNTANPDFVFVHGDTTTSMAAALSAFYQQIPVVHVEAGLRTHNIYSPWPEEMNRQITGRIATYHLAPTELSRKNLLNEGIEEFRVFVTGNTVIDALQMVVKKIKSNHVLEEHLKTELKTRGYDTTRLLKDRKLVLITAHRRENFGDGIRHIAESIKELALRNTGVDFVYPMHLNPNVRNTIKEVFKEFPVNTFFIEPLEYESFVFLLEKSYLVLTDSGGIQEEAPGLGKPVLVMRNTTERPEAVSSGTVKLVGTEPENIIREVNQLLEDRSHYLEMASAVNPYGQGDSCKIICKITQNI